MRKKVQQSLFPLPEWMPIEAWAGYLEMRLKIKKPMTEYAIKLAIDKLTKFKHDGYDPKEILENAILNSWQGLFPVNNGVAHGQTSKADRRFSQISESTRRIFEEDECFSGNNAASVPFEDSGRRAKDLEGDSKKLLLSGIREGDKRIN